MSLGPVVAGARLAEDEVVGAKDLSKRSRTDRVHRSRLEIHQGGTRNIFTAYAGKYRSRVIDR